MDPLIDEIKLLEGHIFTAADEHANIIDATKSASAKQEKAAPTYSDAIEWVRKEVIEKACEWLKENIDGGVHPSSTYGFVEKFKKAMEE